MKPELIHSNFLFLTIIIAAILFIPSSSVFAAPPVITSVDDLNGAGTYTTSSCINFRFNLDQFIEATYGGGFPYINLIVGHQVVQAEISGYSAPASGDADMLFSYCVDANVSSTSGVIVQSPIIIPDGSTIKVFGGEDDIVPTFTPPDSSAFSLNPNNPEITSFSPSDNETNVLINEDLTITFDEAVDVESGNIEIYKASDDSLVEQIDVTSDQVTGTGTTTITIDPDSYLLGSTEYYILFDGTAFDDASSNSVGPLSETTFWSFTTQDISGAPVSSNINSSCSVSDTDVETGEEVTATVDITVDQKPHEFEWTQILDGDGEEQTHIFEEEGEFTIRGKVYDNMGNSQLVRCPEITVTEASNSSSSNNTDTEEDTTDEETEENVNNKISGSGSISLSIPTTMFDRDLVLGSQGQDVKVLQQLLNSLGFTLADEGPGSPGNETNYYGTLTQQAVAKLQTALNITPANGLTGERTRSVLNFIQLLRGLDIL
jgi:hypothetical protein